MLIGLVRKIQSLPRHLGQHSGGIVIAAQPLDEIVPLEPASMPGRVVKVLVMIDAVVKAGAPLLIIEAMKMESQVPSPIDGKVVAILVSEGDNVKTDETVIQLE